MSLAQERTAPPAASSGGAGASGSDSGGGGGGGAGVGGKGATRVFHVSADGKLYNYKKEGTEQIVARSETEVQAILRERATLVHGLGAGGNHAQLPTLAARGELGGGGGGVGGGGGKGGGKCASHGPTPPRRIKMVPPFLSSMFLSS